MNVHWHVGQKIVCVRDAWTRPFAWKFLREWLSLVGEPMPRKDQVYTIAEICADPWGIPGIYLALHELPGNLCEHVGFRPVVEHENDISIFTKILDRVNKRKPAKVRA